MGVTRWPFLPEYPRPGISVLFSCPRNGQSKEVVKCEDCESCLGHHSRSIHKGMGSIGEHPVPWEAPRLRLCQAVSSSIFQRRETWLLPAGSPQPGRDSPGPCSGCLLTMRKHRLSEGRGWS